MFLSQKVSGGVWYLVDSQKEVDRDSGKVRYKKVWRSTHTEDRGAAENILQEKSPFLLTKMSFSLNIDAITAGRDVIMAGKDIVFTHQDRCFCR